MNLEKMRYDTFKGKGHRRISHWEHWSNPDAETYLTGIDHYEHPQLCRLKLQELYPQLGLAVPESTTAGWGRSGRSGNQIVISAAGPAAGAPACRR